MPLNVILHWTKWTRLPVACAKPVPVQRGGEGFFFPANKDIGAAWFLEVFVNFSTLLKFPRNCLCLRCTVKLMNV